MNKTDLIPVWIQDAGCQERKMMLNQTYTVDDLIKAVHDERNDSDSYQASYGVRQMQLTDRIPGGTTPIKPIILTKIGKPQSAPVNIYQLI